MTIQRVFGVAMMLICLNIFRFLIVEHRRGSKCLRVLVNFGGWFSVASIAEVSGLSRYHTINTLDGLHYHGLVERKEMDDTNLNHKVYYRVTVDGAMAARKRGLIE